jgi:hypothetical protein
MEGWHGAVGRGTPVWRDRAIQAMPMKSRDDDLVRSQKMPFFAISSKDGIQWFQFVE